MRKGRLIVLEGYEGVGKTTQCRLLVEALNARGCNVVSFREPGGTVANEKIREVIMTYGKDLPIQSVATLFIACKKNLLEEKIFPALAVGQTVILDRYTPSLLAYQTATGELPMGDIMTMLQLCEADYEPDMYIHLDTNFGIISSRLANRGGVSDTFEEQQLERSHAIYQTYGKFFNDYQGSALVNTIDAAASIDEVQSVILSAIEREFPELGMEDVNGLCPNTVSTTDGAIGS